jgi:hypothetical protein
VDKTIYKAPNWLHLPAAIDPIKLPSIQRELLQVSRWAIKDISKSPSEFINVDDVDKVLHTCPTLVEEFKRLGILDIVYLISIITVRPGSYFPIHIDYPDPGRLSFGLNIPVLNCTDSYTVWYNAKVLPHEYLPEHIITSQLVSVASPCDEENAIEIGRVECSTPSWINNHVPHRPHCLHDKFRINSSFRFTKKIFEMINDGYFDKNLVRHD